MTKALEDIGASVSRTWKAIAAEPAKAIASFRQNLELWSKAFDPLWNKFQQFGNWLSTTFSSTIGSAAKWFSDAWTASFNWVSRQISSVIGLFRSLTGSAIEAAKAAGAAVGAAGAGAAMASAGGAPPGTPGTSGYQAAPAQMVSPTGDASSFGVNVYRGGSGGTAVQPTGGPMSIREEPHATGGYIRGPGTGTSDSIFARLSNGEFVLNAGSVRRLGVGFLQSLNSFAAGGLVGASPIRFAAGGLASASAGRAVHLHLGSQSFALSGSAGVVDALVSEAHWQQTRSAGVKPSWFAGRPSGR
jgi:hypothetical protein